MFCITVALYIFAQIAVNLLFIAEEKIDDPISKNMCKILSIVPRHFTNPHMFGFIRYLFAAKFVGNMVMESFDLALIKNGYMDIGRSTLSNVDTLTFPLVFLLAYLNIYFMKKGQLIRMFHLSMFVVILNAAFRYLTWLNLVTTSDFNSTMVARGFSGIIEGMDCSTFYLISFFNTIVNKSVGNTGITLLISINNQTKILSDTLGLFLIGRLGFSPVVISCLTAQFIFLVLLYRRSSYFDKKDSKLFDVSEPSKPEPNNVQETVVETLTTPSLEKDNN